MECVACRGALALFGPRRGYRYFKCQRCASVQLWPIPEAATLEQLYRERYVEAEQIPEFASADVWRLAGEPYRLAILRALQAHRIDGPILDVGAGWGFLCDLLRRHGYNCRGVEMSADMARWARRQGYPVTYGAFDDDRGPVSTIVLCAVFEHLCNQADWLARFAARVPSGGWLVSLHPVPRVYSLIADVLRGFRRDAELPGLHGTFAPPWHTALISPEGLHAMADCTGWIVQSIRPSAVGRTRGIIGVAQRAVGAAGALSAGKLATTHVCVLRRK